MTRFPIDEWERRAAEVRDRLYPPERPSAFAENPLRALDPEFASLVETIARGRSYADETLDLKTRALCTAACLVGMGEQAYIETWVANAMQEGATREEIVELMVQLFTYVGTPKAVTGFAAAKAVFDAR